MLKSTATGQMPLLMPAPLYVGLFLLTQRWAAEKEGGTGLNNNTVTIKNVGKWLLGYPCALSSKKK